VKNGVGDVLNIHHRLDRDCAVCLRHTFRHSRGQFCHGVADVDLADGNVVLAAIER